MRKKETFIIFSYDKLYSAYTIALILHVVKVEIAGLVVNANYCLSSNLFLSNSICREVWRKEAKKSNYIICICLILASVFITITSFLPE